MRWCARCCAALHALTPSLSAPHDEPAPPYACDPRALARPAPSRAAGADAQRLPARPRPHRPLHRVPPPGLQDAGLPQPRRRPVPHAADALARSGAARPLDRARAAAQRGPGRGHRAGARPRPHALRPRRPGRARRLHGATHGGFEHNLQSLRVVDALEQRYPQFDGLNLSFETREGILKHCSRANAERLEARRAGRRRRGASSTARSPAWRRSCATWPTRSPTTRTTSTTACARACSSSSSSTRCRCSRAPPRGAGASIRSSQGRRLLYETIRRMLSAQVDDVIDATARRARRSRAGRCGRGARSAAAGRCSASAMRARVDASSSASCSPTSTAIRRSTATTDAGAGGGARAVRRLPRAARRDAGRLRPRAATASARWPTTSPA